MWRFWLYSILFQIIYPCFKLRISSAFAVCWCQLIVSIGQLRITNDYRASEIDWVDPFELSRHRNIFGAVQHLLFLTNPKSLYTFFVNCSTALESRSSLLYPVHKFQSFCRHHMAERGQQIPSRYFCISTQALHKIWLEATSRNSLQWQKLIAVATLFCLYRVCFLEGSVSLNVISNVTKNEHPPNTHRNPFKIRELMTSLW
jgi:hypothetical protein